MRLVGQRGRGWQSKWEELSVIKFGVRGGSMDEEQDRVSFCWEERAEREVKYLN